MSGAPRAFHIAVRNAAANIATPPTGWTWKYDGKMYYLRRGPVEVGTLSFLHGNIERESWLMDVITDHLNKDQPLD